MSGSIFDSPLTMGLLGLAQGFGQSAMPSRMHIPFGAVMGMGAQGFTQGEQAAQQGQLQQQQLQAAKMQNQLMQARLPMQLGLYGSLANRLGGAPAPVQQSPSTAAFSDSSGAVQPAGTPQGAPGTPPVAQDGIPQAEAGGAQQALQDLQTQRLLAMANGDGRTQAAIEGRLQNAATSGVVIGSDGKLYRIPGAFGAQGQMSGAKAWGGVAPAIAQAGGTAAAEAPYKPPVTITTPGADGVPREQQIPLPAWASYSANGGASAQPQTGAMPAPAFAQKVTLAENASGNPNATNATSTATGNDQFLNGTWLPLFKQTFPQMAQGMSDADILGLRNNPAISQVMTVANARANAPLLQQAGQPVNAMTLGLAHRFGAAGATTLLQANPDAPVVHVLPPSVLQANPDLQGQSVRNVLGNTMLRFGTAPVDLGPGAQQQTAAAAIPGAIPGKPVMTPEQTADSEQLGKQSAAITEAGAKAPVGLQRLDVLQNAANAFRPGMTAQMRLDAGRGMADVLQGMGVTPPDWLTKGVAGGETIGKEGGFLAAEMTRSLGSREAASVFNQVRGIMPNIELSQGGFQVIVNSLRQGLQRDQDLMNFRDQWLQDPAHTGSIRGMTQAFEQNYPVEAYASRVVPYPVPQSQSALKSNVLYSNKAGQIARWDGQHFTPITGAQ